MRLRMLAAAAALTVTSSALVAAPAASSWATGTTPQVLFGLTDKWKDQITADDNQLQLKSGVVDMFSAWDATSQKRTTTGSWLTWVRDRGAAPMLTLQPPSTATLKTIIAGNYDGQLKAWAHTFAAFNHPMFFRLFPEMNQKRHPAYSPGYGSNTTAQFRTAWQHVVTVVRSAGGTNVRFLWCPYRVYSSSTPLKSLWPGARYVDWVSFDAYNYDDSSHPFAWPYALFSPTVKAIRAIAAHKPLMIAEVGANTDSQKPVWIGKSVTAARSVGAKIMLWFDQPAEHNWRLDSSSAALTAARVALHSNVITYAGRTDVNGVKWTLARIDQLVSTGT